MGRIGRWLTGTAARFGGDVVREAWQAGTGQQAHNKRQATAKQSKERAGDARPGRQERSPAMRSVPASWYKQPPTPKQIKAIQAISPSEMIPASKGAASDLLAQLGAKPIAVRQQVTPERRERTTTDLASLRAKRNGREDVEAGGGAATVIEEYRALRNAQIAEERLPRPDRARLEALGTQARELEKSRQALWKQARQDADTALQRAHAERIGSRAYWEHLRAADAHQWQADVLSRNNLYRDQ